MSRRMIIRIGGLVLCVLFFTLPLVQCSQDSSINATGVEIATGTGDLEDTGDAYPLVMVLLLGIPALLLIVSLNNDVPFSVLRYFSIAGLSAQVIFMIIAYSKLNSGEIKGAFELTPYNWLVVAIHAGMVGFIQYCIKQGTEG